MSDIGQALGEAIVATIILFTAFAFLLGILAAWGLPKLWIWIKPMIHTLTG